MSQSRKDSFAECITSTFVGYWVAVIATQIILPKFGIPVRIDQNLAISAFFTVISVVRSYIFRRIWNHFGRNKL